jgi:hypothetical protein
MSEIAVKLTEPELAELVISTVEAFQYSNGPYLEHQHRAIARELGHNEGRIERLWRKASRQAYNDLAAIRTHLPVFERFDAIRPKIDEAKRKLAGAKVIGFRRYAKKEQSSEAGQSFSMPAPQPVAVSGEDTPAKGTVVAEIIRREFGNAKPKPEEEPEETMRQSPSASAWMAFASCGLSV